MSVGPSGSTSNGYPFPIQDDQVDVPRDIEALARAIDPNANAIIVGEVRSFALAVAPPKWLVCDGSAKEQSAYPELFQALGARFNTGGESSTQFRVPSIASRSVVGAGTGAGLATRNVGDRFGQESVTLSTSEMPWHGHGVNDPGHDHQVNLAAPGNATPAYVPAVAYQYANWNYPGAWALGALTGISIAGAGGGGPHYNIPPSIALLMCVYAGRV